MTHLTASSVDGTTRCGWPAPAVAANPRPGRSMLAAASADADGPFETRPLEDGDDDDDDAGAATGAGPTPNGLAARPASIAAVALGGGAQHHCKARVVWTFTTARRIARAHERECKKPPFARRHASNRACRGHHHSALGAGDSPYQPPRAPCGEVCRRSPRPAGSRWRPSCDGLRVLLLRSCVPRAASRVGRCRVCCGGALAVELGGAGNCVATRPAQPLLPYPPPVSASPHSPHRTSLPPLADGRRRWPHQDAA